MASNIDRIQRASAACREAAEALDEVKPFRRYGLLGLMVNTGTLIGEAGLQLWAGQHLQSDPQTREEPHL